MIERNYRLSVRQFITSHSLLLTVLLASCVRLATLAREPYWYDESFTALIANLSPSNAIMAVAGDVHPPVWYLIEWLIARVVGTGELAMRFPAAIFGVLACYQIYRLLSAMGYRRAAGWAALAVALLPAQLYYSQEARAYSLLNWLVLFAATSIYEHKSLRSILALCLLMYTHNLAFLYVAPLGVWLLIRERRTCLPYLLISLSCVPWLLVEMRQAAQVASGFWIVQPGPGVVVLDLVYTTFFVRIPPFAQVHIVMATIFITLITMWHLRKDRRLRPVAALIFAPCVLMYIISVFWHPIQLERALLPSGTLLAGLWAVAALRIEKRQAFLLAVFMLPAIVLSEVGNYVIMKEDYQPIIQTVEENAQPGDVLYHATIPSAVFMSRYISLPQFVIPEVGDLDQSLTDQTKTGMGIKQLEISIDDIAAMGYRRLWVLRTITPGTKQSNLDRLDAMLSKYRVVETWTPINRQFARLDIILIELR